MSKKSTKTNSIKSSTTNTREDAGKRQPAATERWQDADELRWAARHWAVRIGVKLQRVQVREMRTKWASISTAGRLTLNTDLLNISKELGDFVIVHELVHLLAPNHGRVFKSFLHAYLPDWQQHERALQQQSGRIGDGDAGKQRRPQRKRVGVSRAGRTVHKADNAPQQQRGKEPLAFPAANSLSSSDSLPWPYTLPPVLVVDDDPGIRSLLCEALAMEGFTVRTAEHGGPALDILRTSTERMVVLLGLVMPVVNGEDVLEAIAADKSLAGRHTVVMVTAATYRATTGRVAELRKRLGVPLLAKPFTVEQFFTMMEDAVRRWASDAKARSRR